MVKRCAWAIKVEIHRKANENKGAEDGIFLASIRRVSSVNCD